MAGEHKGRAKTKPIPQTMRGKKRYILFELVPQGGARLDEKGVSRALWETMLSLYGSVGTARQKLWLVRWNPAKSRGILRCALEHTEEVKAGLLFLKSVSGSAVLPRTLKTSGSVGKLI